MHKCYHKEFYAMCLLFISITIFYLTHMKWLIILPFLLMGSLYAQPSLVVLGTVQDAGSPQIGCTKDCCKNLFSKPDQNRKVVSLGLIDKQKTSVYLFEATPDITAQLRQLKNYSNKSTDLPDGIFLTHAHIGHYSGLMYMGREAMNAKNIPVYTMPKMKKFLETNGPWSQLVSLQNISLQNLQNNTKIELDKDLSVTPFLVPHRDEYSETVGYQITGPNKKALFIPDIDKWEKWNRNIDSVIANVDYAFIDATFFDAAEINNRDISEIPHPFIIESMQRFDKLPAKEKNKIYFIHFNHTNPLLQPNSLAAKTVLAKGFKIARIGTVLKL